MTTKHHSIKLIKDLDQFLQSIEILNNHYLTILANLQVNKNTTLGDVK